MAGYPSFNVLTDTAQAEHYRFARIPKTRRTRDGREVPVLETLSNGRTRQKMRKLQIPCPELMAAQKLILSELKALGIGASPAAHAYVRKRGIHTNAAPHVGHRYKLDIDLRDFFPSVSPHVVLEQLEYFLTRGYMQPMSRADRLFLDRVKRACFLDGGLPQGAPTSPFLSNLAGAQVDFGILKLIESWRTNPTMRWVDNHGERRRKTQTQIRLLPIAYTRYSDDMTFTADYRKLYQFQYPVIGFLKKLGYKVAPEKIRFRSIGSRMTVCGVVVNEKLSAPRPRRRALRARLHKIICDAHFGRCPRGGELTHRGPVPVNFDHLAGLVNHVNFINPDQGASLQLQLRVAQDVHHNTPTNYSAETRAYLP